MGSSVAIVLRSDLLVGSRLGNFGGRDGGRTQHHFRRSDCLAITPAARITLITPATKPTSTNTMRPHGLVGNTWSHVQPSTPPTRTPATSSEESRNPMAMPEALPAAVSFSRT